MKIENKNRLIRIVVALSIVIVPYAIGNVPFFKGICTPKVPSWIAGISVISIFILSVVAIGVVWLILRYIWTGEKIF